MRIVFGIHSLEHLDGTSTSTNTVGDHLQRTGHDVYIYSSQDGPSGDSARALGLRVVTNPRDLPDDIDAFLVQDGIAALELLEISPETPQIYIWHSELFDVQLPPQIPDVTKLIVTLYGHADTRVKSLAVKPPVLQLTQPVDVMRFQPLRPISAEPRRLVTLGNYLAGERLEMLIEACKLAGIEFKHFGLHGEASTNLPEIEMNAADIVVGKGRVALEGLACGRAVYVFDAFGSDGWITRENYPEIEASCFAGTVTRRTIDVETLAAELRAYDPAMGDVNRELALANHNAVTHAGQLVEAIEQVVADATVVPSNDNAFELARMARVKWRHEGAAYVIGVNVQNITREQQVLLDDAVKEQQRLNDELEHAHELLRQLEGSARWRIANRLLSPLDKIRSRA